MLGMYSSTLTHDATVVVSRNASEGALSEWLGDRGRALSALAKMFKGYGNCVRPYCDSSLQAQVASLNR